MTPAPEPRTLVLGAGAWGTALAIGAARHGTARVTLWARDAAQALEIAQHRENTRYLPGLALPDALRVAGGDALALAAEADLVIIATPMAALREWLLAMTDLRVPVAWLCKGFERAASDTQPGLLGHEIAAEVAPALRTGVLSGPSFAQEVARGQPTALVAASAHAGVRDALVAAFHGPTLRVYANDDVAGVEVGGAVKNVLAIATGLCDGLDLGLNARAALVTRGLAEITRLGLALGARPDTFMGLSGLGDLVLTATGDLSRNRQVGLLLARGQTLAQAVASLGHVAEGVYSARTVAQRARLLGVDMPITDAVVALIEGRLQPAQAVAALMGRDPKHEGA
jgi:glycerol-3-phosphate dehydrogenase (NAD(P)+)